MVCDRIEPPQDLQQMLSAVTEQHWLRSVGPAFDSAAVLPPVRLCYKMTITSRTARSVLQTICKAFMP